MRTAAGLLLLITGAFPLLSAAANNGKDPAPPDLFTGEVKAVIYVTDVEARAPFYRDVLGFEFLGFAESEGEPYYAEMAAGGLKFGLHEPMTAAQKTRVGRLLLYFRVRDLAAQRARVAARGGEPGEIKRTDWMDMFTVRDPDGNEIVFAFTDPARHPIDPWHAP